MSWSINSTGTPLAVANEITNNQSLPDSLKKALCEICADTPYSHSSNNAISVEGCGHAGEGSYIHSLKVFRLTLAKEPAVQNAAPDPANVVSPL